MQTAMALRKAVLQKGDRGDITSGGTADGDIETSVESVPPAPSVPPTLAMWVAAGGAGATNAPKSRHTARVPPNRAHFARHRARTQIAYFFARERAPGQHQRKKA